MNFRAGACHARVESMPPARDELDLFDIEFCKMREDTVQSK